MGPAIALAFLHACTPCCSLQQSCSLGNSTLRECTTFLTGPRPNGPSWLCAVTDRIPMGQSHIGAEEAGGGGGGP